MATKKKLNDISNSLVGKILMGKDRIIKVATDLGTSVNGYDIITEEFCIIPKQCLMKVTPAVLKLLGSERAQVLIAEANSKTNKGVGEILGCSERTAIRKLSAYFELKQPNQWSSK